MITLDLSILNQKGTPMFNSDTLANRPAAGIVGRIFIAIDSPYGIYRDTGSAWDQISGAGSFSGSIAADQVAFGSATNTIAGSSDLLYNNTNKSFQLSNSTNSGSTRGFYLKQTTNDGAGNLFIFQKSRGGVITSGTTIGVVDGEGFDGANYQKSSRILFTSSGTISSGIVPGTISFFTANNSGVLTQRTSINETGLFSHTGQSIFTNNQYQFRISDGTFKWDLWVVNNVTNTDFRFIDNNGVNAMILYQGGNVSIGNNNNNARLSITGAGTTSATNALLVTDSTGQPYFAVRNDGQVGTISQSQYVGYTLSLTGGTTVLGNFLSISHTSTAISGITNTIRSNTIFNPTSGTSVLNGLFIQPTINQTGGANGITRGLYIAPVLTSAADWRSIHWDNNTGWGLYGAGTALNYLGGTLGIKTTSPYAPSTFSLDVNGGLLVKNTDGTTAQITLINADPSLGGNNGFLVASVGGTSGGSYVDFQGYYGTSIVGSTALRLNPAGGAVIVNSTSNTGEQFQLTGTIRVNGQTSGSAGGNSGQHLIINCDGTSYKIVLLNP